MVDHLKFYQVEKVQFSFVRYFQGCICPLLNQVMIDNLPQIGETQSGSNKKQIFIIVRHKLQHSEIIVFAYFTLRAQGQL